MSSDFKLAALFVDKDGPYSNLNYIDFWDEKRDARKYSGPFRVIAHPPCERWGRYWGGGPSAKVKRKLGDDGGCFESALSSVRKYGGVLEHPQASHAFRCFSLPIPSWHGGWTEQDEYGGRSCCVAQGHYGHAAQKMTWLYLIAGNYPELIWGTCKNKIRMDAGFHSSTERRLFSKSVKLKRLSKSQRILTPLPFRDLLIELALS